MCLQVWLLVTIAAGALGALVDSARRAAPVEDVDEDIPGSCSPLERLERARAAIDDGSPRMLGALAVVAWLAALPCARVLEQPEVAAVLAAIGIGLAVPGISGARDQRRRARELDARIAGLRSGRALTSGAARPRRS